MPADYAPYSLIIVGELRKRRIDRLCDLIRQGHSQFYLYSKKLTPDLDKARKPFAREFQNDYGGQLGFAGLILLQILDSWPHSLCLVDKVCHVPTTTVQYRAEYKPLFEMLKRKIKKRLVHFAESPGQWWDWPTATDGVAKAVRAGQRKKQLKDVKIVQKARPRK